LVFSLEPRCQAAWGSQKEGLDPGGDLQISGPGPRSASFEYLGGAAIRSRWQRDAVPPWRRVEPTMVCDVRVTNLDLGRWARFPVAFVRWRTDRSVDDCGLEQLSS
jgi:hypothetical protein